MTFKVSKTKLTNAEIAVAVEILDSFEKSGFAWQKNHGRRTTVYIERYGLRFEVLTAVAQSAVIDFPEHFRSIHGGTKARYNFLLTCLMQMYEHDARITYHEGPDEPYGLRVEIAFSPPKDEYCITQYEPQFRSDETLH